MAKKWEVVFYVENDDRAEEYYTTIHADDEVDAYREAFKLEDKKNAASRIDFYRVIEVRPAA